jgi:hypothetical protein
MQRAKDAAIAGTANLNFKAKPLSEYSRKPVLQEKT